MIQGESNENILIYLSLVYFQENLYSSCFLIFAEIFIYLLLSEMKGTIMKITEEFAILHFRTRFHSITGSTCEECTTYISLSWSVEELCF